MAHLGESRILDWEFVADGAITNYTAVKLSTDDSNGNARVATCGTGDQPIGIAQETVADGATVRVRMIGTSLAKADGAYSLGDLLGVADANGELDTASPSAGANKFVVGVALEAASAAGELKSVLLCIGSIKQG